MESFTLFFTKHSKMFREIQIQTVDSVTHITTQHLKGVMAPAPKKLTSNSSHAITITFGLVHYGKINPT